MQSRGLFAQLVQIPGLGNQVKYRHLHAVEVAIHNGVPPMQAWSTVARLNLCVSGQLASPFHATWVATALVAHVQKLFTSDVPLDPNHSLGTLKQLVMQQSKEFFPTIPRVIGSSSSQAATEVDNRCRLDISDHAGASWTLVHQPQSTVRQLIEAECDLLHLPIFDVQVCDWEGQALSHEARLKDHQAVDMMRPGFQAPAIDHPMPEVPFQPEDLLPCPTDVQLLHASAPAGVVDTQVDSDADMMPSESHPDDARATAIAPHAIEQNLTADDSVLALFHLTPASLLEMIPPMANDAAICMNLRALKISWRCRVELLSRQEHVWADDELLWRLQASVMHANKYAVVLDPLLATSWISAGSVDLIEVWLSSVEFPSDRIASAVLHQGHWTPVLWIVTADRLEVHTHEHDDMDINFLNGLHGLWCQVLAVPSFTVSCLRRAFGVNLCGAAAVSFLIAKLNDA